LEFRTVQSVINAHSNPTLSQLNPVTVDIYNTNFNMIIPLILGFLRGVFRTA